MSLIVAKGTFKMLKQTEVKGPIEIGNLFLGF